MSLGFRSTYIFPESDAKRSGSFVRNHIEAALYGDVYGHLILTGSSSRAVTRGLTGLGARFEYNITTGESYAATAAHYCPTRALSLQARVESSSTVDAASKSSVEMGLCAGLTLKTNPFSLTLLAYSPSILASASPAGRLFTTSPKFGISLEMNE